MEIFHEKKKYSWSLLYGSPASLWFFLITRQQQKTTLTLLRSDGSLKKKETDKMKRQMSRNQEKIEIFNASPRFRKSLLYTSSTKKSRSEFFLIHHSLKKYLHFSHTWLDNKYSIFAIKIHRFCFSRAKPEIYCYDRVD